MRNYQKHRTYHLRRKRYHLEPREKLLFLFLFIFLAIWLLFRTTNIDKKETTLRQPTMQRFLEIAIQPIGSTMYIWGGGWNDGDEKSGTGSTRIGVSPIWEAFAKEQDASYDYEKYRYERELGLDCSGYVGWVVYNLFETEDGKDGYVTFSTEMAENFANRGWGKLYKNPKQFFVGDIVSMEGHVWICLGTCEDGSVLLVHSSPPGVSICGTELSTRQGDSIAVQLAKTFMETYYKEWQTTYPNRSVSQTYLEEVTVLRWNVETLEDVIKYQQLSGEEILQILSETL